MEQLHVRFGPRARRIERVRRPGGGGCARLLPAPRHPLRLGQQVYTPDTPGYPDLLREIYNPPAVLYVRGTLPDASGDVAIGVVGTRKAGKAGLRAAREISYELAQEGAAVISGGALGVDSEAHRGAIDGRGRTVAVLPCGLDYPYLMDNANLRREILDSGGALVTEYPCSAARSRRATG